MAGSVNAGSIIYEVDMDTAKLLAARREVDAALNGMGANMGRLEASVNRTERSISSMQGTMSSLTGVAKGLLAALSVQQVGAYADEWTVLNNKLANAARTGETQAQVMQRVFDISQATQTSLNGTATLYARLERGTRLYNTSAEDLVRLTTIINQGFAVSGATAQEAENAIIQLSQGLASGVLRGEEFNSVAEQGSRLTIALADSLGVGIGQLRKMAGEGKLTADVVVKGLLSQGDAIGKEFAKTTVTISQGLLVAGNNITKFFGENSTVKSFAAGFRDSIITVTSNLETLSNALIVVAGVMGSRYAAAFAVATAAKIKDTAASIESSKAAAVAAKDAELEAGAKLRLAEVEKALTIETLRKAEVRLSALRSTQASTTAEVQLAEANTASIRTNIAQIESEKALEMQRLRSQITEQGRIATATRMAELQQSLAVLNQRLAASEIATSQAKAAAITAAEAQVSSARLAAADATNVASVANGTYTASQEATIVANRAASASVGLLRTAFALVGGPTGVILLAAAGLYYWFQKTQQAKEENIRFAGTLDTVISKIKDMDQVQLKGNLARTGEAIDALREKLQDQVSAQDKARNSVAEYQKQLNGLQKSGAPLEVINAAQKRLTDSLRDMDKASADTDETSKALSSTLQKQSQIQDQLNQKARDSDAAFDVLANNLREKIPNASAAAIAAMSATLKFINDVNSQSKNSAQPEEPKVSDKAKELIKSAERRLALSKLEGESRAKLQAQYDAEDAGIEKGNKLVGVLEAQYAETERNTASRKENNRESKKAANQAESVAQKLAKLKEQSELAAESTQELTREKAILNAQQSLGKGATDNDIRQAGEYAAKTFDSAKAVRDLAQAEQGRKFATQEIAAANVMPDAVTGTVVDPTAQIDLQEQQKLAALAKYQAIDTENTQIYEDAKTAIQRQASNARQQIIQDEADMQSAAISSIIGSVAQGFDGLANLAAGAAGRSSGAYQAMFALSKGFAVAQSALNLQLAISQAMADPTALTPAQKLANYASIASAGAGVLSTIGSISYGGGREHGGPVNGNSMYRVGEGGKPEIYKASNGNQYMIPGDNGRVISNSDIGGSSSGSMPVINQVNNFTFNNASGDQQQMVTTIAKIAYEQSLRAMKDQQRPGGMLRK